MIKKLKQLTQHSAIYGAANVLNRTLAFLLLPLYTSYLTTSDYGILEIFVVSLNFLIIFLPLGLNSAVFAFVLYSNEQDPQKVISSSFHFLFFFAGLGSFLLYTFSPNLSFLIFANSALVTPFQIISITVFFECLGLIPLAKLRIENRATTYAVLNTSKFTLNLLLNIYFVVYANAGIEGILKAGMISAGLTTFLGLFFIIKDLKIRFSWSLLRDMLKFGAPLVPSGIAISILTLSDRYFLKYLSTLNELGLYSFGYRFGMILTFLTAAFQTAWPTFLFSIAKEENAKSIYAKLLTYYVALLFFLFLLIAILSKDVIKFISTPQYHSAYKVVPLILLSYICYGVYYMTAIGVNLKRKTHFLPLIIGAAAALNLLLNYLFIPKYGMMGAAAATFICYFLMVIGTSKLSLYYYYIRYELDRIVKVAFVAFVIYFSSFFIQIKEVVLAIVLKLLLISLYPFLLYLMKFYQAQEIANFKNLYKKILNSD
ncbi:MAG: lipopolysaccharide biosynthesis protein [bacterium]